MLSFSFFRKKNRRMNGGWVNLKAESEYEEKIQAELGKSNRSHKMVKKFSPPSEVKVDVIKEIKHPPSVVSLPTSSKSIELSKISIDKPLPPTPAPNIITETNSKAMSPKDTCKTRRIMAPLSTTELHDLFSGAPHFLARSNALWDHHEAPYPDVEFRWNSKNCLKNLRDYTKLDEPAWGYISASLLRVQNCKKDQDIIENHGAEEFDPLSMYRERPSTISMQGSERGTLGFCAALELPLAHSGNSLDHTSRDISFYRANFLESNNLLRPLSESMVFNRLVEISRVYDVDPVKQQKSAAHLHAELFTHILQTPAKKSELDSQHSFDAQILSLLQVLSISRLWIDFSELEWQLQLGQILWLSPSSPDRRDRSSLRGNAESKILNTERYWLLLQILLGCEILLRLDILTVDKQHKHISMLREKFGHESSRSIIWSLFLARVWLENIRIEKLNSGSFSEKSLVRESYATITTGDDKFISKDSFSKLKFHGKYQARQISGLIRFADAIKWPNLEKVRTKLEAINIDSFSIAVDAMEYMSLSPNKTNSNFRNISWSWQTISYINGLMLPGGSLSCLIISALLENDTDASSKLVNQINSQGGFIYLGKSFWRSSCIVGRVLAATKGASECIGWISSDVLPTDIYEGWINIKTKGNNRKGSKARIWHKNSIEKRSDVIASTDPSSVLIGDFTLPLDKPILTPLSINLLSLELNPTSQITPAEREYPLSSPKNEVPETPTFSPTLRFLIKTTGERDTEFRIKLAYDVHFVTVHPCIPPKNIDILQSPTNPSFPESAVKSIESQLIPYGHPLHKAFTYTKLPLSHILSIPSKARISTIVSQPTSPDPSQSSLHTTSSSIPKVLVIDCTEPQLSFETGTKYGVETNRELLARAICAERGWNALISRQGQVCLACSIREASALDWRVIIRLT
ncbi:hypothetical protein K3495_g9795 [Podosphaera aphanis]|nr:hypothetical protein K3495_g9795 [Podosphaera aphanis]